MYVCKKMKNLQCSQSAEDSISTLDKFQKFILLGRGGLVVHYITLKYLGTEIGKVLTYIQLVLYFKFCWKQVVHEDNTGQNLSSTKEKRGIATKKNIIILKSP